MACCLTYAWGRVQDVSSAWPMDFVPVEPTTPPKRGHKTQRVKGAEELDEQFADLLDLLRFAGHIAVPAGATRTRAMLLRRAERQGWSHAIEPYDPRHIWVMKSHVHAVLAWDGASRTFVLDRVGLPAGMGGDATVSLATGTVHARGYEGPLGAAASGLDPLGAHLVDLVRDSL